MTVYRFDMTAQRLSVAQGLEGATAAMPDLLPDTLYVVQGTTVKGVAVGTVAPGVWRSRTYVYPSAISFSWAKVQGTVNAGYVVRLYADDVLIYTRPTSTSKEPFRVPARRARRWAIEVESTDRITGLRLAQASEELP